LPELCELALLPQFPKPCGHKGNTTSVVLVGIVELGEGCVIGVAVGAEVGIRVEEGGVLGVGVPLVGNIGCVGVGEVNNCVPGTVSKYHAL